MGVGASHRRPDHIYRVDPQHKVADENVQKAEPGVAAEDGHTGMPRGATLPHSLSRSGHVISGTYAPGASEEASAHGPRARTVTVVEPTATEDVWTCGICSQRNNSGPKCTICQRPRGTALRRDFQTVDEITQSVLDGISRNQSDSRSRRRSSKGRNSPLTRAGQSLKPLPTVMTLPSEMLETMRPAAQAPALPTPQLPGSQRTVRPEELSALQGRHRMSRTTGYKENAAHQEGSHALRNEHLISMRQTAPPAGLQWHEHSGERSRDRSHENAVEPAERAPKHDRQPLQRRPMGRHESKYHEDSFAEWLRGRDKSEVSHEPKTQPPGMSFSSMREVSHEPKTQPPPPALPPAFKPQAHSRSHGSADKTIAATGASHPSSGSRAGAAANDNAGAPPSAHDSHDSLTELLQRCGQLSPTMLQPPSQSDPAAGVRRRRDSGGTHPNRSSSLPGTESRAAEADYVPPPRSPIPRPPRGHQRPASPNGPPQPLPQTTFTSPAAKGTQSSPSLQGSQSSPSLLQTRACECCKPGSDSGFCSNFGRSPAKASWEPAADTTATGFGRQPMSHPVGKPVLQPFRQPEGHEEDAVATGLGRPLVNQTMAQAVGQPGVQPVGQPAGQPEKKDDLQDAKAMLDAQMNNLVKLQERLKNSKRIA